MDLNELIRSLIEMYYNCYPTMIQIPVDVAVSDNLEQSHYELRPDRKEQITGARIEAHNDDNGRMVVPHEIYANIHILLNQKKVVEYTQDKSMTWIGTLAHELTHAIDFYQMARKEHLSYYDPLEEINQHFMFQLWSEYHARKFGYGFLRYFLGVDQDPSAIEDRVRYIADIELSFHAKRYFEEYHKGQTANQQIYCTMQFLGRYSVWCDLYPEWFNQNTFATLFSTEKWLYNLLVFLKSHETLDTIYSHFDDMRLVLKDQWAGL